MSASPQVDRDQPSFLRFPIQNDRTGFQPVFLPMILVVPRRRNANGTTYAGSGVFDVKFYIVDAPNSSKVAGPFNTNLLVPQLERFVVNVSNLQLSDVFINPTGRQFYDTQGNTKSYSDAVDGDSFEYTLLRGSTASTIPYYKDADYYDLSFYTIDVEDLPRPDRYLFVWEAKYYRRTIFDNTVITENQACIDQSDIGIARFSLLINHPGEVHHEMFRRTPPFYFDNDNFRRADDPILQLYRPFADILQDIFDEQRLINGINHIDKIPAQLIPYLAYLIGWDLPNFPGVTDTVRRSILRQAVRLQQLKGSRRALVELFDIFGFTVELLNLWYSTDGTRLIAPDEALPDTLVGEEIKKEEICQSEPLVANYDTPGFGEFEIPLVYRATNNITINAWLVNEGPTQTALNNLVETSISDPDALETICTTSNNAIIPVKLLAAVPANDPTVIATSEVVVNFSTGKGAITVSSSTPLIGQLGINYDKEKNIISVVFDHHIDFADNTKLFIFATYPRDKLIIPSELSNLRSNRFDVQILLKNGQQPSPELLEFLMQFIFKLKAFHSLLRKIIFRVTQIEAYNVTDYCFTELQVPPPVNPGEDPGNVCEAQQDPQLGLKDEDINTRSAINDALAKEHETWRALDGTHQSDPTTEHLLNLPVSQPDGTDCQFTQYGQDRVKLEPNVDLDHNQDERSKLCDTTGTLPANCFKGRVKDQLSVIPNLVNNEIVRCKPCVLGQGSGSYWLYPSSIKSLMRNGFGKYNGQNTTSFLGKKIKQYNGPLPRSIHYNDRPFITDDHLKSDQYLAYRRPSLEIEKDNLLFPSHRFPVYGNLENDYKSPDWRAKPWDNKYQDLNANINESETLEFDDADLVYIGNNLTQDISTYGTHDQRSYVVTHKIYLVNESPSHPAVSLDMVTETTSSSIIIDSSVPFGPIFRSFNENCNSDFRGGYPSEVDEFDVDIEEIDFDRDNGTDLLGDALELPSREDSSGVEALFSYSSQILVTEDDAQYRYYIPYRYDCDCERFVCSGSGSGSGSDVTGSETVSSIEDCTTDLFRTPEGDLEFHCDRLTVIPRVILQEIIGACSNQYDGVIPNYLCIFDENGFKPVDLEILPTGSIRYKDDYGVIYEVEWTFETIANDGKLDITFVTKSPGVWGEDPDGFVDGLAVYRKGIITTVRQIIRTFESSYEIQGESSEQVVGFFQSNLICGDERYVDNFCFHHDCMIVDEVDYIVDCGPRWAGVGDAQVQWPELIIDSGGNVVGFDSDPGVQPFHFINIWNNIDITPSVCVATGSSGSD